jgi:hypothetical protein
MYCTAVLGLKKRWPVSCWSVAPASFCRSIIGSGATGDGCFGRIFLCSQAIALESNLLVNVIAVENQVQLQEDLVRVHQLILSGTNLSEEDRLGSGTPIEITKGPLKGLHGKILSRGKQLKFFVEIHFLQRTVSAEIGSRMLERVDSSGEGPRKPNQSQRVVWLVTRS